MVCRLTISMPIVPCLALPSTPPATRMHHHALSPSPPPLPVLFGFPRLAHRCAAVLYLEEKKGKLDYKGHILPKTARGKPVDVVGAQCAEFPLLCAVVLGIWASSLVVAAAL
jgi:hypothetical protein